MSSVTWIGTNAVVSKENRPSEQEITTSRVYARALLKLTEEQGVAESVLEELDSLVEQADRDKAFASFLTSPLVEADDRQASLDRIFRGRMSELLLDTIQVMNRKGRMRLVSALGETYRDELEKLRGEIRVHVRSAVALDDAQRQQLSEAVSQYTSKQATLVESVDESLIGGVVLRIGDQRIDTSVAKQLSKLEEQMLGRVTQELHTGKSFISEEAQ
jgi:F-type H+-transporting ATPase subunit delta